ncbi:hypothetical protein [Methanocella sp. MCL-LM]|uniref:hypothetical protein n=1 Tax=Methanocella sp. MCL-LM TaxID=3412035 RepID=UPI003C75AC97
MVSQVATAEQVSMIVGRITVNGHPQENVAVSGFGTTDRTGPDGQYALKFESAGAGVINATYDGHHASSGLIVIPSGPLIRAKDLDIQIPYTVAGTVTANSDVQTTPKVWTRVPAPIGTVDAAQIADHGRPFDISGAIILISGAVCIAFICFLIYVTVRK